MVLGSPVDGSGPDGKLEESNDVPHEDGDEAAEEDTAIEGTDLLESSTSKRRSFKGKPRIANAVDTSRLNKHLTNIWSAKRKKPAKKTPPSSLPVAESETDQSELQTKPERSELESEPVSSQASTVIIVKTMPTKVADQGESPATIVRELDDGKKVEAQKGSRDIAERLKARKQRYVASADTGGEIPGVVASNQVTCELCAEAVADYSELVDHVRQQHEDCTYVRGYLDEIQPIADALTAVSLPCSACGRTFAGQAALSAHRHECTRLSATGRVSKLGAQRKRVTANFMSEHPGSSADPGQQNGHETPAKSRRTSAAKNAARQHECDQCKRKFTSPEKLTGHVARMHSQKGSKRGSAGGQRGKQASGVAGSKSAGDKLQQLSNANQSPSMIRSQCDHCKASFSRTSLLITHMKYCLKADSSR